MRRRLFWTIVGVAAATGLAVLLASLFTSQRAAVNATYREMEVSTNEAITVVQDTLSSAETRPTAILEILRLLEGDQLGSLFGRIRRLAGGSEIGFGVIAADETLRTNAAIFDRIDLVGRTLETGRTHRLVSETGELVVVSPAVVDVRGSEVTLLVALAREAPIVRLADQGLSLVLLVAGIVILAGIGARILASQLASRLEPLAEASRSVAAGDMTVRIPAIGDPDLDEVGAAFNDMATELEATREREREFILGVGHDLRTPLTTIGGYAEALESGEVSEDELQRIGSVLGMQSRQLGRLIDDLSLLARLEQTEFGLRTEPVDVGAHVSEVIAGFARRADELGVKLDVEVEPGHVVDTDPDRLAQIAQNLVENALRHTPEAGSIHVAVKGGDQGVVLSVADTGTGIASEDLPHVFDRHFVGRRRSVRNEGSGLGLSIVKGLVDRMGGTVEVESTPGRGTAISVTLDRGV